MDTQSENSVNDTIYENALSRLNELSIEFHNKRDVWLRHVLLASASLFGILISLHNTGTPAQPYHWAFALGVSILGIGVLTNGIALAMSLQIAARLLKDFSKEVREARLQRRAIDAVSASAEPIFGICEKISYICYGLSVLFLCSYFLLCSFAV